MRLFNNNNNKKVEREKAKKSSCLPCPEKSEDLATLGSYWS